MLATSAGSILTTVRTLVSTSIRFGSMCSIVPSNWVSVMRFFSLFTQLFGCPSGHRDRLRAEVAQCPVVEYRSERSEGGYAAKAGNGAAGANYDRRDRKGNRPRGAQRVSASRSSSSEFSARPGSWSGSIGTTSSSPVSRRSFANG